MARKLELAPDVVRALEQLAAGLFPYDNRSIRPPDREGWIRLAVAELAHLYLRGVARRADGLVQVVDELRGIERVALAGLRLGGSLAGLV